MVSFTKDAIAIMDQTVLARFRKLLENYYQPTGRVLAALIPLGYQPDNPSAFLDNHPSVGAAFKLPKFLAEHALNCRNTDAISAFAYLANSSMTRRQLSRLRKELGAEYRDVLLLPLAVAAHFTGFDAQWSRAVLTVAASAADCDLVLAATVAGWTPEKLLEVHAAFGKPMTWDHVEAIARGVPYEYVSAHAS